MDKRRFVSQTNGNLYIANVEASDKGNYSCFVSSPSITKSVFSKFIPLIPLPERKYICPSASVRFSTYDILIIMKRNIQWANQLTASPGQIEDIYFESLDFSLDFHLEKNYIIKCPKVVEFGLVASSSVSV